MLVIIVATGATVRLTGSGYQQVMARLARRTFS